MFKTVDEAIHFIESQRAKRSFEDFQKIIERYQGKAPAASTDRWNPG